MRFMQASRIKTPERKLSRAVPVKLEFVISVRIVMICLCKRATRSNALIITSGIATDDFPLFHLNAEIFLDKINGG